MAIAPTMTAAQFDALRRKPRVGRLTLDCVDVARAVMVDGMSPTKAGQYYGMTRQRVHGIVQRFRIASEDVPAGWRHVEVWLPPELAGEVEDLARKARANHDISSGSSGASI